MKLTTLGMAEWFSETNSHKYFWQKLPKANFEEKFCLFLVHQLCITVKLVICFFLKNIGSFWKYRGVSGKFWFCCFEQTVPAKEEYPAWSWFWVFDTFWYEQKGRHVALPVFSHWSLCVVGKNPIVSVFLTLAITSFKNATLFCPTIARLSNSFQQ